MRPLTILLVALAGCAAGESEPPKVPTVAEAADVMTCAAATDPLHPMLVEWPAANRANLESIAQGGPVVVRYADCTLAVLTHCRARDAGRYDEVRTTPATDALEIARDEDLYATLPLGAAKLKAKLAGARGLRLTYVVVGERVLHEAPAVLEGECSGATHYVDAMVLGAFSLEAHARTSTTASVEAGRVAAGGEQRESDQIDGSAGDVAACAAKGLDLGASCRAVLRVGLRPLRRVSEGASGAWGAPVAQRFVVPELGRLNRAAESDFAKLDVPLMELLQAAKQVDGGGATPDEKARAWTALAEYPRPNPYADAAALRRDEWRRVADAERARLARVLELCPRYEADRARLGRLQALDERTFGRELFAKARHQFESAYEPWAKDLAQCALRLEAARQAAALAAFGGANDGLVPFPAGTFVMGTDDFADARPLHTVAVSAFGMDVSEVTVGAYRRCVQAHVCGAPATDEHHGRGCSWRPTGADNLAVNCVDWEQAKTYCAWTKKRLPTEEEWEYAARGARDAAPNGAEEERKHANRVSLIYPGSISEWTATRYAPSYDEEPTGDAVVVRWGGFSSLGRDALSRRDQVLRADHRDAMSPDRAVAYVGFRCAR